MKFIYSSVDGLVSQRSMYKCIHDKCQQTINYKIKTPWINWRLSINSMTSNGFFFAPPVFVSLQTIISCISNWFQIEIAIAILRWNGCLDYFWRVFVSLFLLAIGQLRFFFGHNFNLNEIRLFRIWSLFFFSGKS